MNGSLLPGVSGSLLPARFLADEGWKAVVPETGAGVERTRVHLGRWWATVSATCGPATGIRAIADLVLDPLAGALGFRVRRLSFADRRALIALESRAGGPPIAVIVLPWSSRPSGIWRELVEHARSIGAAWAFVLAPPYFSVVDARGHAVRRHIDFTLPAAFSPAVFPAFWAITNARGFTSQPPQIARLVDASLTFAAGVRRDLQAGVVHALHAIGAVVGPFEESLTIVYRVLFLLFAESRDLVPHGHPIYRDAYTIGSLCREAVSNETPRGLWDALGAITRLSRTGCDTGDLIVRPFNGRLFARQAAPSLEPRQSRPRARALTRRDHALRSALTSLATRPSAGGREAIHYADLGVEQLGAVYERILDLDPDRLAPASKDQSSGRHSRARKETGTFYTPQALCDFVVRRTLTPLVSGASADDILDLRVVDPAMGSGAFLVSACRFLATAYEQALVDEGRVAAEELDDGERADLRRLVAERCLYGVDLNPTAVQLARLSLWLATLARGKPLGFLDHRLRCGNSLIGTTPDRLRRVPDDRRRPQAVTELPLFDLIALEGSMRDAVPPMRALATRRDDTVDDVRAKETVWAAMTGERSPLRTWRQAADLWCARWLIDGQMSPAETRAAIDGVLGGDRTLPVSHFARRLREAGAASDRWRFFHWPLEFPEVFYDASGAPLARPGFDAVIGNPPWEMLRQDGAREPEPRNPGTLEPRNLGTPEPRNLLSFLRCSSIYPHCASGHLNLYQPFLERSLDLCRSNGRAGLVVPWGLAVDEGAANLRAYLFSRSAIDVIVGLDNGAGLFPIHRGLRFMALVTSVGRSTVDVRGRFGVRTADELSALPGGDGEPGERVWPVTFAVGSEGGIGGRTRRIPDARRTGDLALAERLARDHPRLGDSSGWGARFSRELNATDDRDAFGTKGLPVIEGKHLSPFVVSAHATSRRVSRTAARRVLPDRRYDRDRLAYRDVSGVANRVSLIAAIVPAGVVTTHTVFCLRTQMSSERQHFLCACFNSYVANAIVRLLMGSHVTTALIEDLPVPLWQGSAVDRRIARLARRLSRAGASPDLAAAVQAAVARRYGLDVPAFARLLEGFPLVPVDERQRAIDALARVRVSNLAI